MAKDEKIPADQLKIHLQLHGLESFFLTLRAKSFPPKRIVNHAIDFFPSTLLPFFPL